MVTQQMKRFAGIGAALALTASLSGCFYIDADDIKSGLVDGVTLDDLDMTGPAPRGIAVVGPDNVIVTDGESLAIEVEGDSEVTEKVRFEIDGGDLTIGREDGWKSSGVATVRVTMPAPSEIAVAGSGSITADRIAKTAELDIAGSGGIEVEAVDADRLEIGIGGAGKITGAGTARYLEVNIAGSGDVRLAKLMADNAEVSIAGSGNVAFSSNGEVEASIAA